MRSSVCSMCILLMLTGFVGGCGGDDSSDGMNGGLSPIVDEDSGWVRIKSIPQVGPTGIGVAMSLTAAQHVDGSFALLENEIRGSQGGEFFERFTLQFADSGAGEVTSAPLTIREKAQSGGMTSEYRYGFAPGTATVYQSFRESNQSGGFGETTSGLRTDGDVTVGELRSPGGFQFAGLADLYEDGRALIPGAELNSAYFHDGDWERIYGRYRDINEPTTYASYPVELADRTLVWALLQEAAIGIGVEAPDPTGLDQQQVKRIVVATPPAGYVVETCYARAFGNQIVFLSTTTNNGVTTMSAHRWTEGGTTIETLYAGVSVPATMPLPPVENNKAHRWLLDVDGTMAFFADQSTDGNVSSTALIEVTAAGPRIVSMIPAGHWAVQGPWLLDDKIYAGIGTIVTSPAESGQLDFVRLQL